jgi:hypothetical protein
LDQLADKVTNCPETEQRIVFIAVGGSRIALVEYTPTRKPQTDDKAADKANAHVCFKDGDIQVLYRKLVANQRAATLRFSRARLCEGHVFSLF